MSDDDVDVKSLAERLEGIAVKIVYGYPDKRQTQAGALSKESAEALARVALGFCDKRERDFRLRLLCEQRQILYEIEKLKKTLRSYGLLKEEPK